MTASLPGFSSYSEGLRYESVLAEQYAFTDGFMDGGNARSIDSLWNAVQECHVLLSNYIYTVYHLITAPICPFMLRYKQTSVPVLLPLSALVSNLSLAVFKVLIGGKILSDHLLSSIIALLPHPLVQSSSSSWKMFLSGHFRLRFLRRRCKMAGSLIPCKMWFDVFIMWLTHRLTLHCLVKTQHWNENKVTYSGHSPVCFFRAD